MQRRRRWLARGEVAAQERGSNRCAREGYIVARAQERTSTSGMDMATAGRASLGAAARSTVPVGAKADADATKVRKSCRTDIKR